MNLEIKESIESYANTMIAMRTGMVANPTKGAKKDYYYVCMEDLLVQEGEYASPKELSAEQKAYVNKYIEIVNPKVKGCFQNAQSLATYDGGGRIKYHEGIALFNFIPLSHAWNSIDGVVFDVTWSLIDGYHVEDIVHLGVEFPTSYVRDKMISTKVYDSLLCGVDAIRSNLYKEKFNPTTLKAKK